MDIALGADYMIATELRGDSGRDIKNWGHYDINESINLVSV